MDDKIRFTFRVDEYSYRKYSYVCSYDGRSVNSGLAWLIRQYVKSFEQKNREITKRDIENYFSQK